MIQKTLRALAKQIFWLFSIAMVLSLPLIFIVGPAMEDSHTLDGAIMSSAV